MRWGIGAILYQHKDRPLDVTVDEERVKLCGRRRHYSCNVLILETDFRAPLPATAVHSLGLHNFFNIRITIKLRHVLTEGLHDALIHLRHVIHAANL